MNPLWQQIIEKQGVKPVPHAVADQPLLAILDNISVIEISGNDAERFLHSQLSNDVVALGNDAVQLQAYCNPKGRMFGCFFLMRVENGFWMALPTDVTDTINKRLTMFVMRSDVKITPRDDLLVLGLYQPDPSAFDPLKLSTNPNGLSRIEPGGVCYQIANSQCYQTIANKDSMARLLATDAAQQMTEDVAWHWQMIRHGQPQIVAATSEQLVPQMVNLDLIDGVSFDKGCYPGQEIVARMHYLGKTKQRMVGLHSDNETKINTGDKIISGDKPDQALGVVIYAAKNPEGGADLLASIRLADLEQKELHIIDLEGPAVTLFDLPYELVAPDKRSS